MDKNQRGWALRYLREAIDEIRIAGRESGAFNLVFDALRKAQMAVYCSLGDPMLIDSIISEVIEGGLPVDNPILRCLVELEKSIKNIESMQDAPPGEILRESCKIISTASKITILVTSLLVED